MTAHFCELGLKPIWLILINAWLIAALLVAALLLAGLLDLLLDVPAEVLATALDGGLGGLPLPPPPPQETLARQQMSRLMVLIVFIIRLRAVYYF
jgi:hypothetical protein